ncbi:hypothetical protein EF513_04150 [Rickettsiales endosymbiont of Stachyamoeba lipophora]|nr:hypothetical protein EF513_04150 [Rickettsiales endosymbiont of Stachyamoeba lipophora]
MTATILPLNSFYFIRHGQTNWNVEGCLVRKTDIPF